MGWKQALIAMMLVFAASIMMLFYFDYSEHTEVIRSPSPPFNYRLRTNQNTDINHSNNYHYSDDMASGDGDDEEEGEMDVENVMKRAHSQPPSPSPYPLLSHPLHIHHLPSPTITITTTPITQAMSVSVSTRLLPLLSSSSSPSCPHFTFPSFAIHTPPTTSSSPSSSSLSSSSSSSSWPSMFITAVSNHGAGLGHQFGEWVYGPYLSFLFNLTYVYGSFKMNSQRWNTFLGWGDDELTPEDIRTMFPHVMTYSMSADYSRIRSAESWVSESISRFVAAKEQQLIPADTVALFQLFRIHVPHHQLVCRPELDWLLRAKYCMARIRRPLDKVDDIYAQERAQGKIVVAVHLRCGDSCNNPGRATSFTSVNFTMHRMRDVLSSYLSIHHTNNNTNNDTPNNNKFNNNDPVAFHLFSQLPRDDANWFAPLLNMLHDLQLSTHFHMHSSPTLHNLASADVLLGAQSSFSWVASILHNSVVLGPVPSCRYSVPYRRENGWFDERAFVHQFEASRLSVPRFRSLQDCYNLKRELSDFHF